MTENSTAMTDLTSGATFPGDDSVKTSPVQVTTGVAFVFLILFGSVFNSALIHTFRKTRNIWTPTNLFIVGLACNDIIMVVIGMPFVAASCFEGTWIFGSFLCVGYGFMSTIGGVTSISILTAIAVDRFIVVTKPYLAKKITMHRVKMTLLVCSLYGIVWATLPLLGWGDYVVEKSEVSCGPDWHNGRSSSISYNAAILVFVFVIPVSVIVACYIQIIRTVRCNRMRVRQSSTVHSREVHMREMHVTVAVFVAIVSFILAWSPYAILSIWTMVHDPSNLSRNVALLPPVLAKSASAWNPIIYVARNREFRKAFTNALMRSLDENNSTQTNVARPTQNVVASTASNDIAGAANDNSTLIRIAPIQQRETSIA